MMEFHGARAPSRRVHGGIDEGELRELGIDAEQVLDFSVSCNPYGPSDAVVAAIHAARLDRYPDPTSTRARLAIAQALGCSPDAIAVGNGAADLLWALAHALVQRGSDVVIAEPTFSEFRVAVTRSGATLHEHRADPSDHFAIDLARLGSLVRDRRASVVYLCVPNTPTGQYVPIDALFAFARDLPFATIVLDQSFLSLSDGHADRAHLPPRNVVCVRSITKDHALPGLRVGYLLADPALVRALDAARPSWPTSALAEAAVVAAFENDAFVAESRRRLEADREALVQLLDELHLPVVPTVTHFLLVRVGDAASLRARLLARHAILVRDTTSFGLPDYVRVAVRPRADTLRLAAALRQELS